MANMVCNLCANLDLEQIRTAGRNGYKHHSSYAKLFKSAQNGCEFCGAIIGKYHGNDWRILFSAQGRDFEVEEDEDGDDTQILIMAEYHCRSKISILQTAISRVVLGPHFRNLESEYLAKFPIYTNPDDPCSDIVSNRRISSSESSWDSCFETVRFWLKTCQENHEYYCNTNMAGSYTLPTRVIDIGDNSREPRLFEPNGLVGQWLALSHCWGGSQPLTTTTGTLSARKTGIPLEEFPPLFKDAISVTRRLGHQYLWIDSLCIIQDSRDDWLAESSKMGDIYKHSTLTLVTEGIRSCNESFFEKANVDRENHSRDFLSCGATSQLHKGSSLFLRAAPHKPAEGYVSRRAWTLQEDILSPRLLILTTDMVRWECQGTKYAEDRPDDNYNIPGHLPDTPKIIVLPEIAMRKLKGGPIHTYPADSNAFGLLWSGIVQKFASRSITYETDRLPAISALARQLGKQAFGQRSPPVQWRYLAGLWEQDIHAGLLWSTNGQATRYDTYVAPSWSWASLDMTKKNKSNNETYVSLDIMYCNWNYRAKLVAAEIETSDRDPFGQVSRGYLQLESAFRRADSFSQERIKWLDINDRLDPKSPQSIVMAGFIACCLDTSNELQSGEPKSSQAGNRVFFQIMARTDNHEGGKDWVYALILEPADDSKLHFRRVGLALFPMYLAAYSDALSNCWDVQTVTIV